jgi:hypothetical protein
VAFAVASREVVLKNGSDRPFCRIREFPCKFHPSRQIARDERIASRSVLTVPWCPDRYTACDTNKLNQIAVIDSQKASVNNAALLGTHPLEWERITLGKHAKGR